MKIFTDLREAYSEIKRDLSKAPILEATRVQNKSVHYEAHEAMGYHYTVLSFPVTSWDLIKLGVEIGALNSGNNCNYHGWLRDERLARQYWQPGRITEVLHRDLDGTLEGNEPSYTYTDRLRGAVGVMAQTLAKNPDSRRAYWPIYLPEDAVRGPRLTRTPCSLGYHLMIRNVNDKPQLHMTYLQRSCDFDRFWLSDIWLARQFQQ